MAQGGIADKLITGVANAASVLHGFFHQTADQIGSGLQHVLNQTPTQVAQALKGMGESAQSITSVLKNLGHPPDVISTALKGHGESAEAIAGSLNRPGSRCDRQSSAQCGLPRRSGR